ncbi:histidine phosphatase family protein (plasmid) [Polymorphobacter megasporae]|nr:histidine phosphatase family protein [Polymorphobacter megasporae]
MYFVRHGETAWSLTGQHTGRTDLALTTHGEAQARALAPALHGIVFAHVLTSPLQRAQQTCALTGLAAAAVTEPDLIEWDYGKYEGLRSAEIREKRPAWSLFDDGCPSGETPDQVAVRADRLIARLAPLSGNIAVFSHKQFGCSLAMRWIDLAVAEGQRLALDTASLSVLGHDARHCGTRVIELWNFVPDRFAASRVEVSSTHP